MNISIASEKGLRPYQEDEIFVQHLTNGVFVGVFDGHGGDGVSKLASKLFQKLFPTELLAMPDNPSAVLEKVFEEVVKATRDYYCGSTASVAYITDKLAWVATLGDSPVVVQNEGGVLHESVDHNVRSNLAERKAAEARGGFVRNGYLMVSWDGGGLQMARALGDRELDSVLSRTPDIFVEPLGKGSWVLLASDGVFDPSHGGSYTPLQGASDINVFEDANFLVNAAVARKTGDNASAILVRLT